MKEGLWLNYRTGEQFPVSDHEQWIRIPNNATKAGVPPNIVQQFQTFHQTDRSAFLLFIMNNAPLMRVRGHGADIAFEYASRNRTGPLDTVYAWAKQNAGPFSTLRLVNFSTNEKVTILFKDFEQTVSEGGYEAVMRIARLLPRQLMAEVDTEFCVRLAGSREDYLRSLNATPEIIQYIVSQDPERSKWLTNQFRKNPQLSLEALSALQPEETTDPATRLEYAVASLYEHIPGMVEWVLIQLRKYRSKKIPTSGKASMPNFPPFEFEYVWPPRLVAAHNLESLSDVKILVLDRIRDWVNAAHPQLASYDLEQANEASDQWHEEVAQGGAGGGYERQDVIFDFGKVDKKYSGWTIQEVQTENDLNVEGNRMGHCVGSYCQSVSRGDSSIFSLRDPQNNPHVTIEVKPPGEFEPEAGALTPSPTAEAPWEIVQIQGKGNAAPIKEYKKLVREWVQATGNIVKQQVEDSLDVVINYTDPENVEDLISNWNTAGKEDEYGLQNISDVRLSDVADSLHQLIELAERQSRRDSHYRSWMGRAGRALVQLMSDLDQKKPIKQVARTPPKPPNTRLQVLEDAMQKREEKLWDQYLDYDTGEGAPNPDDFATTEEFNKAEEKYHEEESEARSYEMRQYAEGGILHAMWDELNDLRKEPEQKAAKNAAAYGYEEYDEFLPFEKGDMGSVPESVLRAWKQAHNAKTQFDDNPNYQTFTYFVSSMQKFIDDVKEFGAITATEQAQYLNVLVEYVSYVKSLSYKSNAKYDPYTKEKILHIFDSIINNVHESMLEATLTDREQWYDWEEPQKKKLPYMPDPWMKELWERRVRHDRSGRSVSAAKNDSDEFLSIEKFGLSEQVPTAVTCAWKQAHDAKTCFDDTPNYQTFTDYASSLRKFIDAVTECGTITAAEQAVYSNVLDEEILAEAGDKVSGLESTREAMTRCAALPGGIPSSPPRSKITPHDVFPGDTVKNKGEQDYWQPWDDAVQWDADGKYGEPFVNDRRGPGGLGVPVPVNPSVSDDNNTRKKVPRMFQSKAYSIAPLLQQRNMPEDSELLVRLPDDIYDRYRDLASRVKTYAQGVDLHSLDAYDYPQSPPQQWVDREMRKYPVDRSDANVAGGVLIQADLSDLVDWFDMRNLDEAQQQALAPRLHSQYILENDGKKDFATWFIEDAPFRAGDKTFMQNFLTSIQENPKSTFGQRYDNAWRKKNNEEITNTAHQSAHEQWLDAIRGKVEFSRAEYRPHLETLHKLRNEERVPIHDTLSALEAIPVEDASIAQLRSERDSLVNEGMHAMDLYREPVSRDDRLLGDLEPVGERVVPVRRIFGDYSSVSPIANSIESPLPLYQYGSSYFLVHESDAGRLQRARKDGSMCVTASVTKVIPGSSIRKRVALTLPEWQQKTRILRAAIDEVSTGVDKESVFEKYGRQYGPGLRRAIDDFLYVKAQQTDNVRCANWENQQSADNCGNCTFWPNGGGDVEFGYGDNGCNLTDFFLNSPDSGHGRRPPTSYDSESNPPKQKGPRRAQEQVQEKDDERQKLKTDEEHDDTEEEFIRDPEIEQESPGAARRIDIHPPSAGATIPTEPVPLDRLNDPQSPETLTQVYGRVGTLTPGTDTTDRLKIYDLSPFVENPDITKQMLSDTGFNVEYFSFEENPERGVQFRTPDLKRQGYNRGYVWIYDPRNDHGSFKDSEYTRAWRVFHEVGHGITEQFMFNRYGPSKREGRLGVEGKKFRGKPPQQQAFTTRPLTLMEAQRAVEWEDVSFRAQRILQEEYGVSVSDEEFAQEMNINIIDAVYRVLTGDFGNPGENGFLPSSVQPNVHNLLQWLENQENALAVQQGRPPTSGIDLASWKPISDDEIRAAIQQRKQRRRGVKQWGVVKRANRHCAAAEQEDLLGYQEVGDVHFRYSPEELNMFSAAVLKRHYASGGSTFNFQRGDLSGKAFYALSLYPERTVILRGEIFPEDVREFIEDNADVLSDARHSIGTWVNPDGNTELDVIVTIPGRFDAVSLARQYNQKAIMNLENYDVIMTQGTGESKKDMPEERYLDDIGARSIRTAEDTQNFLSQIDWKETFEENFADVYPQMPESAPVDDMMSDTDTVDALIRPSTEDSQRFVGADGLIDEAKGSLAVSGAEKRPKKPKQLPGLPPSAHPGLAIRPPDENQGSLFGEAADPDVLRSKRGLTLPAPGVYNSQQYQNVLKQAPVVPFDPSRPESIDESIAFLENTTGLQVRHQTQKMRPVEFFLFPTEFGDMKANHVVYAAWFALYSANTAVSSEEKQFVTWQAGQSGSDPQKLGILSRKNKLIELLKFLKWAGFPKFERLDAVLDDFNPSDEAYQSRLLALSRQAGVQPKVGSFMLALLGDRRSPTLDMHAIGYLIGKGKMEVPEGYNWTPLRDLYELQKKMGEYADKYGTENAEFQSMQLDYTEKAQANKKAIMAINAQTRINRNVEKAEAPGASPKILETEKRKIRDYMYRQLTGWDGDTDTFWGWYAANDWFETHEPRRDMIHTVFFQSLFPELFTPEALRQREYLHEQYKDDPEGLKQRLKYRDYLENLEEMRKIRKVKPKPVHEEKPDFEFDWESGEFEIVQKAAKVATIDDVPDVIFSAWEKCKSVFEATFVHASFRKLTNLLDCMNRFLALSWPHIPSKLADSLKKNIQKLENTMMNVKPGTEIDFSDFEYHTDYILSNIHHALAKYFKSEHEDWYMRQRPKRKLK